MMIDPPSSLFFATIYTPTRINNNEERTSDGNNTKGEGAANLLAGIRPVASFRDSTHVLGSDHYIFMNIKGVAAAQKEDCLLANVDIFHLLIYPFLFVFFKGLPLS